MNARCENCGETQAVKSTKLTQTQSKHSQLGVASTYIVSLSDESVRHRWIWENPIIACLGPSKRGEVLAGALAA
jgi:hypothetical protein